MTRAGPGRVGRGGSELAGDGDVHGGELGEEVAEDVGDRDRDHVRPGPANSFYYNHS
jgi:hypothetical protein